MAVLVTGGSGGLGVAACRALAERGHAVAVGFWQHRDVARDLVARLRKEGRAAMAVWIDVTDPAAVQQAVDEVGAELGGIDAVVNAAAQNADGLLGDLSAEDVSRLYAVNVGGTMNCVRAALPSLIGGGRGRVINFASVIAGRSVSGVSAYAGTKGAIESLTRSLAVELASKGITVNAVSPGYIDAGLGRRVVAAAGRQLERVVPLRRAGTADEVASVVAFLASEEARYITGITIPVDGGFLAGSTSAVWGTYRSGERGQET